MLYGITILLSFQLLGELLSRLLGLPLPGPVIGLALLFAVLIAFGRVPAGLRTAAEGLLRYLALLFVPAGVGLMVHYQRLEADAVAIAAALVVSTALALALTGLVFQWRRLHPRRNVDEEDG
ncbi:antiholin-like protein LrgA [Halorhodospira halochloris]|uniref:Antiholin-like protein LrgA n=1 Tax=Halorhodospira halochloris TaxID=1052 RepID=A0A0X8X8D1_HALHR|nr:CidA/LrgA family protein [Halorhodospira halochloris]MBK1651126.1 murein hydrolase regulator LrgA [Halorhodospira halochloris]BAU57395.1 antiholin-like protein LrgA [Halorhodospira halochloris]